MNNNEDNNSPVINNFTIIQSIPRAICTGTRYLGFAFETLHYPWIPSSFPLIT